MTDTAERQSTVKRRVHHLFVAYHPQEENEAVRDARRGDEIEITQAEAKRLDGLGALAPEGASARDVAAQVKAAADAAVNAVSTRPEGMAEAASEHYDTSPPPLGIAPQGGLLEGVKEGSPAEPPRAPSGAGAGIAGIDVDSASVQELAEYIGHNRVNASETVALAEDNPTYARKVIDAEQAAHDGDGRTTVVEPLQRIAAED